MNIIEISPIVFLAVILLIATIYDIRFHRIPNWSTFPAIVAGISYHTYTRGLDGLFFSGAGMLVGIFLLIYPYLSGKMGAGDGKLMGAIGAFLGPKDVFMAFLLVAMIGGIYAIILLALHGQLKNTFKRYGLILKTFFYTRSIIYIPDVKREKTPVLPYGIVIAIGTSVFILKGIIQA